MNKQKRFIRLIIALILIVLLSIYLFFTGNAWLFLTAPLSLILFLCSLYIYIEDYIEIKEEE